MMASLLLSPSSLLRRRLSGPVLNHRLLVSPRRRPFSIDYKPKEQSKYAEAVESLTHRDLTLFTYEAPGSVSRRNLFAMSMLPVWTYLSYFAYSLKSNLAPYREEKSNWAMENIFRASTGVAAGFFLFGCGITGYWMARTMNTVRRLILRKGGKHVTLVTYGLLGKNSRSVNVPVTHCSAVHQNFQGKQRFFLRVRDHAFKYQFNLEEGTFVNKPLFDRTVGLGRKI